MIPVATKSKISLKHSNKFSYLNDPIIQNFYNDYFDRISSKELDKEFNKDILTLVNTLKKVHGPNQSAFIQALSGLIEFYIERKVEKEIDESFMKIFAFCLPG